MTALPEVTFHIYPTDCDMLGHLNHATMLSFLERARWALDLLIVAANQLGVINHVRLTLAAARTAGLRVRGVVLNRVTGTVPDSSVDDNAQVLSELERVPIVELPWMSAAHDLDQAAAVAERSGLVDLIATPTMSKTV